MRVIHKYRVSMFEERPIETYKDVQWLDVQKQGSDIIMWGLVETDNAKVTKRIFVCGTGQEIPNIELKYIGTAQIGMMVWHVFEPICSYCYEEMDIDGSTSQIVGSDNLYHAECARKKIRSMSK